MTLTRYKKVGKALLLYLQMWIVATLLAWILVSIFGFGDDGTHVDKYFDNGIWADYTWEDFSFDALSMGLLIAVSMIFNTLFIHIVKPLQHYRGRAFLYSVLLLATNVAASMLIMKTIEWFWGAMPHVEFVNCTYMYCLVATLISSIHANYAFQQMYVAQQQEKHELQLRAARQEEVSLQASLMALKTQVDPHFLFNNFSILSDLIDENSEEAKHFLSSLAKVYRFKLVNMNADLVEVDDEIRMVRAYVHLLEAHYGRALRVAFPTEEAINKVSGWAIPPLAVQMAVENAVKHNARSTTDPLWVRMAIATATVEGKNQNTLQLPVIRVSNPIRPLSSHVESTGMGLHNLTERYLLTTGYKPQIDNHGERFCLTLPLVQLTR